MPLPSGNWLKVQVYCALPEDTSENVIWYSTATSIPPTTNIQTLSDGVATSFTTALIAIMNQEVDFIGVKCSLRNGGTTITAKSYNLTPGSGTTDLLPNGCSVVAAQQTVAAGRSGRGRHFFSGIDAALADGSVLSAAGITAAAALKTLLSATQTWATIAFDPYVYSAKLNVLNKVSFVTIDRLLGYRRKRSPVF